MQTLEDYGIENTKEFLGDATEWDLGLVTVSYDTIKHTGSVEVLQTADSFLFGFISSNGGPRKPQIVYTEKKVESKYIASGF